TVGDGASAPSVHSFSPRARSEKAVAVSTTTKKFCKIADAALSIDIPHRKRISGIFMSDVAIKVPERVARKATLNEDWLAVAIGLLVFALALISVNGPDLLGWAVTTSVYTDLSKALGPVAKAYAGLGGGGALLATYAALLAVLSIGVSALGADVRKFALAFTAVFAIAYASWIAGSYAYIAAVTPADQQKFGIPWSLKLTNEGGFIVAL